MDLRHSRAVRNASRQSAASQRASSRASSRADERASCAGAGVDGAAGAGDVAAGALDRRRVECGVVRNRAGGASAATAATHDASFRCLRIAVRELLYATFECSCAARDTPLGLSSGTQRRRPCATDARFRPLLGALSPRKSGHLAFSASSRGHAAPDLARDQHDDRAAAKWRRCPQRQGVDDVARARRRRIPGELAVRRARSHAGRQFERPALLPRAKIRQPRRRRVPRVSHAILRSRAAAQRHGRRPRPLLVLDLALSEGLQGEALRRVARPRGRRS